MIKQEMFLQTVEESIYQCPVVKFLVYTKYTIVCFLFIVFKWSLLVVDLVLFYVSVKDATVKIDPRGRPIPSSGVEKPEP